MRRNWMPWLACVLLHAGLAIAAQTQVPRVFEEDGQVLARFRQACADQTPAADRKIGSLCRQAAKAMTGGPYAVTRKKHPIPGIDPHEYVSLAPYYWPNPNTPDHLPYVRHDGRRNPEIRQYDAAPFGAMSSRAHTLALAYYLTGREAYADRAALLLRTWFLDPATRMNPNLEHAQMVKGVNEGRGWGIIESNRLLDVVDAIGLLHGSRAWTQADQQGMVQWFGGYVDWLLHSKNGRHEQSAPNNHGTWYEVQLITYCLFIGDRATARKAAEQAKSRIALQIQPDGSQPRELARTNALSYSAYNIEALTELADLADRVNVDLWNFKTPDGRGIRAAIDWLLPYATRKKKWGHQQISPFRQSTLFVPLRRAARAYHAPKYQHAADSLEGADPPADVDAALFPGTE